MLDLPAPSELARHWALDPSIVFLNHGSFGATPRVVLERQAELRARLEAEPVRFFVTEWEAMIDRAREAAAAFVRVRPDDLVFVPNATVGVATALMNLTPALKPGDELLYTGHEYPACMNQLRQAAARGGARAVEAPLPFPARSAAQIVDAVMSRVTPRTRVLLISHVTSPSALILPIERIVPELESRGVACVVDGAHAPGFVPGLDVGALGASFYTANLHKWVCTPKGCGVLHVREDRQAGFRPLALSNNAERPKPGRRHLHTEFDFVGTDDRTAWLCVPEAIAFFERLVPGGWPEVIRRNHALCRQGRDALCRALSIEPTAPDDMQGCTATLFLPGHDDAARRARLAARPTRYHDALQDELIARHHVQVPVWSIPTEDPPRRLVRISAQLHNSPAQYDHLAAALRHELARERAM